MVTGVGVGLLRFRHVKAKAVTSSGTNPSNRTNGCSEENIAGTAWPVNVKSALYSVETVSLAFSISPMKRLESS